MSPLISRFPRAAGPYGATLLAWAFWLGLYALAWLLNHWTPAWADDWWRGLAPAEISEIPRRIAYEYQAWTGRLGNLLLCYLLLLRFPGSEALFDLLNAGVWLLAVATIVRAAVGHWPTARVEDTVLSAAAFAALWLLTHAWGEAALWTSGALTYLWPVVATVCLLLPLVDWLVHGRPPGSGRWRTAGLALAAAFLGTMLENLSASAFALGAFLLVRARLAGRPPPRRLWAVTGGLGLGFAVLMAASGNWLRFATQDDGLPVWLRFGGLLKQVGWLEWAETHLAVVGLVVLLMALARGPLRRPDLAIWAIFALMLALSMIGASAISYSGRTAFVAEFVAIIVLIGLLHEATREGAQAISGWPWAAAGVLGLWFLASLTTTLVQMSAIDTAHRERQLLMAAYAEHGVRRALLPSIAVPYRSQIVDNIVEGPLFLRDLHGDTPENGWRNESFAQYYGFDFAVRMRQSRLLFFPRLETLRYRKLDAAPNSGLYWERALDRDWLLAWVPGGRCSEVELRMPGGVVSWSIQHQLAMIDAEGRDRTSYYCGFYHPAPEQGGTIELYRAGVRQLGANVLVGGSSE